MTKPAPTIRRSERHSTGVQAPCDPCLEDLDRGLDDEEYVRPLAGSAEGARVHDPRGIDRLFDQLPHAHPPSHLIGDPSCPNLPGAVVVTDRSPKLQRRRHRTLPCPVVGRTGLFLFFTRAGEREIGAATLLVGVTEVA